MRWQQTEFILKGVYLGLLVYVALQGPTWQQIGIVALWTFGMLCLCLGVAAFRKLREGYRIKGRLPAFILFLLLEDESGKLTGSVYVDVRGAKGYFGMLSIDPARQGQGLGARLIDAAEQFCHDAGCRAMEIEVVNLRTELPDFYRRRGYAETGTRPFSPSERTKLPCHFVVMVKRFAL